MILYVIFWNVITLTYGCVKISDFVTILCSLVVIYLGATSVDAYFPSGARWYDLYTFKLTSSGGGATITLDSPFDHIPVS